MQTNSFLKVIIALQAIIVIMLLLHEQQRRTLWNNDTAERSALAQRARDVEELRQKPEAIYANLLEQIDDLRSRAMLIQGAISTEKIDGLQARIELIQGATAMARQNADQIADTNARVQRIEQAIAKIAQDK